MKKRWEVHITENDLDLIVGEFNSYETAERFAETLRSPYVIQENDKYNRRFL